jgi:predicted signal transduction protein with EAL and GGDEF domain
MEAAMLATLTAPSHLSDRDALRRHLAELLSDPAPERRIGMCILDIDTPGTINGGYVRSGGDTLMQAISHRLRAYLALENHFYARTDDRLFTIVTGEHAAGAAVGVA